MASVETAEASEPVAQRTMLIDTDVHESPRSFDELRPYIGPEWDAFMALGPSWAHLGGPYVYPVGNADASRLDWELEDGTAGTDLDALRRHLFEDESVTIGILDGSFHFSLTRAQFEFAEAVSRAYNDWQIEHWLEKEPRLRGSVHVIAANPERAAREIDRVAEHPQIVQVFLPLAGDRQYGDPFYRPIYEAAVRNDLVVTLHHGGVPSALDWPRYWAEWHATAPPHLAQCQLASLIFNGTFDKYPDLKVVVLETGVSWVPWFMTRMDDHLREGRSEVPWVKRLPSEHVRDNIRIATQPIESDLTPRKLEQLIEMFDLERVFVFSTDYPHFDADSAKALPRSGTIGDRIRYQNALETFPRLAGLAS